MPAGFCLLTADSNIMNGVLKDVLKIRKQHLNLKKMKKKNDLIITGIII